MPDSQEAYLQIGEVAERTGVTQRTLRFYEEKGLLRPPTRMDGGFRLYSEDDVTAWSNSQAPEPAGRDAGRDQGDGGRRGGPAGAQSPVPPGGRRLREEASAPKAIDVVTRQHGIVSQKAEQMSEMKSQLEERLRTFDRWMTELERMETQAAGSLTAPSAEAKRKGPGACAGAFSAVSLGLSGHALDLLAHAQQIDDALSRLRPGLAVRRQPVDAPRAYPACQKCSGVKPSSTNPNAGSTCRRCSANWWPTST